jgi:ribose 5-phosphate isomerase B
MCRKKSRNVNVSSGRSLPDYRTAKIDIFPKNRHSTPMKIALGTDHAGFRYKEKVKELLGSLGHEVKDFGTLSEEPVDYPLFIRPAAEAVARGECDRGIVFGGSGNGEAMAANKVHGIRCALCWNEESARLSRQHNDANVLSIGQRLVPEELALKIVRVWLETDFEGGRHERRVAQLNAM